jgi:hypothetical protein
MSPKGNTSNLSKPVGVMLSEKFSGVDAPPSGDYIVIGLAARLNTRRAASGFVSSGAP